MIDSGFLSPARPDCHVPPEAGAAPFCRATAREGGSPASPPPIATIPVPDALAATGVPGARTGAIPATSAADTGLAHRAALRRQLLALLGDEPTGHPVPPELP